MEQIVEAVAHYYVITIIVAGMVGGSLIKAITTMVTNSSRERSRREIAAYIAEGSMSAEQGERLIKADVSGQSNRAA